MGRILIRSELLFRIRIKKINLNLHSSISDPGLCPGSGSDFLSESGSGSAKNPDSIRKNPDPWKRRPKTRVKGEINVTGTYISYLALLTLYRIVWSGSSKTLGSHKLYKWTDQDFKNPDPDQRKNPDPSGSELETLLHRSGFATQTISWCIVKEFFKGN